MEFQEFFFSVRWQDAVDILLNSYILFRLYVLFRGTNTLRVMLGIGCLWFVQRIAVSMGFIVTSWVFQGITAAAALIIIVIFRNEIRAVFQAKNWKTLLWGLPQQTRRSTVDEIAAAVFALAEKRVGALLVFPGKEDLSELIQGGIAWQGLVSREMIQSVFWPGNPVHDGAALVCGDRVARVGGILPLTERGDLPSSWGTRHRAAAGLSERADALVVIVSEERGRVLISQGPQMTVMYTPEQMKTRLNAHTDVERNKKTGLKREAFKLALAGALSLVLVTSVWISFTHSRDTLMSLEVPIRYLNLRPDLEIVDTSVDTLRLHLSGFGALINAVRPDKIAVKLDLSHAEPGDNTLRVDPGQFSLPPGISCTGVSPARIDVVLGAIITRALPVQVDWDGKLPDHLILSDVSLEPETLRITGRHDILDTIHTIYTEKISLEEITANGQREVKPVLADTLRLDDGQKDGIVVRFAVSERVRD